jgi:thiosulfate/3-mercaptopyruvate sulfurtransferase
MDCRHHPRDSEYGLMAYQKSHIENSIFVSVPNDLSVERPGYSGRNPLPHISEFEEKLSAWGVTEDTQVVAYDDTGGNYAARLWWLCQRAGHQKVAVLDGGWEMWLRTKGRVSDVAGKAIRATKISGFRSRNDMAVSADQVRQFIDKDDYVIIDARPHVTFVGEYEWQDPVAGHIPGSINHYYKNNLDKDGCFLKPERLREIYAAYIGDRQSGNIIHTCGSGINACNNLLAMKLAGLEGARLYPGSWSEWCSNKARPYEVGESRNK